MKTKTNKIIAILILSAALFTLKVLIAKASVSDWFSDNINITGPNLEFAYAALNQAGQSTDNSQEISANSPIVQNNYLVTSGTPVNSKNLKTVKINSKSWPEELIVIATGYSSTVDQTDEDPFTTAWGTQVRNGIIAANFLPFGTKIKIPEIFGNRIFVVEDRMNRRYWKSIDIWFIDRESALEFGVKKIKIQILNS